MKFNFTGEGLAAVRAGIEALAPQLGIEIAADGYPVALTATGGGLMLDAGDGGAALHFGSKAACFRGLSLLVQQHGRAAAIKEQPCFTDCGLMLDCSRNAVAKVETVKELLRRMALMGHNLLMLYTEDTYEVPEQPYFGYLRGRYSADELRKMDDYADMLGIEMVPCIQTLGHLERPLYWFEMRKYCDRDEVLDLSEEETYTFIEQMLVAASAPFRSKRIHIGMDEAYGLGLGKTLKKVGYQPPADIMANHLARVKQLLEKHGLQAMMWSDMHFRPSMYGSYYTQPSEAAVAGAPKEIDLVYWDYYRETQEAYDAAIKQHAWFPAKTLFAGGLWTWNGFAPDYDKVLATTLPALAACCENGVDTVIATAWGDDGAETPMEGMYYGLQIFAEYNWRGAYDKQKTLERFAVCGQADGQAFLDMTLFNLLPGIQLEKEGVTGPGKMLLFEDPLMPMFENDLAGLADTEYYRQLEAKYEGYALENPVYGGLLKLYAAFAHALALKCRWRDAAAPTVRAKDRPAATGLVSLAAEVAEAYQLLRAAWREQWLRLYKPYGFEVIDIRLGGQIARLESAAARMQDFAEGKIEDIPELSEEKLPYFKNSQGQIRSFNTYGAMVSACRVQSKM